MTHYVEGPADEQIACALEAGDTPTAARLTFDAYGREVLAFLLATISDQTATQWALAHFGEQLWRGCARFDDYGRSVRCWVYTLARRSALRALTQDKMSVEEGDAPLSDAARVLASHVRCDARTESSRHAQFDARILRDRLPVDDQMLLILRVDRGLSYRELARVMHASESELSGAPLEAAARSLKEHFRSVKAELRRFAEESRPGRHRD